MDSLLEFDQVLAGDAAHQQAELVMGQTVVARRLSRTLDPGRDELSGRETDALLEFFVRDMRRAHVTFIRYVTRRVKSTRLAILRSFRNAT